ncbi:hypothetical protein L0222_10515, partial [bacterium]|nr:hypothetical protein [bacterium]
MKCPKFNILLDLIENRLDRVQARKIETHVNQCNACGNKIEWARGSLTAMRNASLVDAPDYVIQKAISLFPKKKAGFADWVLAKLDFDSWLTPQMAGIRSESAGPRQRIYQTDSYKIILMSEPDRWIGQIVPAQPGVETAGCLVELTSKQKVLVSTVTNQNGEFMLTSPRKKNIELRIHGPEAVLVRDFN